jgi:hypothetical protein
MEETIARLRTILETAPARLLAISEAEASRPRAIEKWSAKEVLGHLVDSASNNHQRFVRGQLVEDLHFPPYEQEGWVSVQHYREEPWKVIVDLWRAYNRHLVHVMSRVPSSRYGHRCHSGSNEPLTLHDHMVDYVRHLEHHLAQILGRGY